MANLNIRNLTINPIELIEVERFEGERVSTGNILSNVTSKVTGFINATDFSSHQTHAKGDAIHKEKASVKIEPFKTKDTNIRSADKHKEVVRLTFKYEDHKYEVDIPSPSKKSSVMKKLDGGKHDLTVVYTSNGAFLAIFSSARLNSWMKELHDEWPLPLLSIPGTHNSPTCHTALPSVRCQAVGVPEQLRNGVRFLDIRVSANPDNDELALVHSVFPISLTGTKHFKDMLEDIYKFLDENPSETILMSIKREGTGKATDEQLGKYLKASYVDKKRNRWWTEPKLPTLGRARGRIVIVRRFNLDNEMKKSCWDGRGWGIDAAAWPDNCEDGKCGGGFIRVQDFYEITESDNIEKKIDYTRRQLERAAEQNFFISGMTGHKEGAAIPPFFVNFLSASNFFNATCWPERIAQKVNPSVIEYLCIRHGEDGMGPKKLKIGSASTGIVVTDWVGANDDWDLIRCIVGMNAKLQVKH
ncbi:PLCXc domain-containing protein [Fusarium keratoplasticum]|uniref:PLCXc domain-containing protein n=1 Tax=Fusarium keratoplasticum TaxID=1328300 RepID=A0ACC0REC4_9HYPO|nr:PLCXc domain-containing protein [Fusarium keratoplasticum]KAI8684407.1 PLCXc domain-containing protein [Fusarium keratoplasticum]KAI8688520.1 PLCXc domain-containing protein [Fusarium keratoplasticum]